MNNDNRNFVVKELVSLIEAGNAHASFEQSVAEVSIDLITVVPEHLPYSIWQMTEHMRIAQWDIVEFCLGSDHPLLKWPDDYWPAAGEEIGKDKWEITLESIRKDRERFIDLLKDEKNDLYHPFAHGEGQSLFREAVVIADHNSYHIGQLVLLRRLLGDWKW
ncbi:DinB family protein [Pedobacter hartonius]|uniref:DinB superfamily protein n=1 Tax=Pedobacter hartonius TaxID=425514 RepID=A0A1H4EJT0_9SPHI|nr:DinB family protein [Pedobacter hartonius]SEA85109.1 DinB superfamily protein [Pedobacter hartonius]